MQKVLVTGVSGYLGCHVAKALVDAGYTVRGTVRDHKWDEAITAAVGAPVEFVQVDLAEGTQDEWDKAAAGCEWACHVASPFFIAEPKDPNELIVPAVEGTTKVLRACAKARMKRVVLTSSTAAISRGAKQTPYSEADWSDPEKSGTYQKSKTLAERAAWDLARDTGLELVSVNPSAIFGPPLLPRVGETGGLVKRLLERKLPGIPKVSLDMVDVRDVALAHVRALEVPAAAGRRFLLNAESVWMGDVARWLKEGMPDYNVPTRAIPYAAAWLVSFVDPQARSVLTTWGVMRHYDASSARDVLGFTSWRPMRGSVVEMAEAMVTHGLIDASAARQKK